MRNLRTLKTWAVYVPVTKVILQWCRTKAEAIEYQKRVSARTWTVIVHLTGTYLNRSA